MKCDSPSDTAHTCTQAAASHMQATHRGTPRLQTYFTVKHDPLGFDVADTVLRVESVCL